MKSRNNGANILSRFAIKNRNISHHIKFENEELEKVIILGSA